MMKSQQRKEQKRRLLIRAFESTAALLLALLVWQLAAMKIGEQILLPTPLSVLQRLSTALAERDFLETLLYSLTRIAGGFFCGFLLGILLAALAAASHTVEVLLRPYLFTIKSVPVASFIVLALVWLSSAHLSLFISFLMVLPIVYTNVLEGIRHTDKGLLEMAEVYRLGFGRRVAYLYVPSVKPYLLAACRVSLGLAWKAGIAAEIIGIPDGSLGMKLYIAKLWMETDALLAYTVIIVLASIAFEKLVLFCMKMIFRLWERL